MYAIRAVDSELCEFVEANDAITAAKHYCKAMGYNYEFMDDDEYSFMADNEWHIIQDVRRSF